MYINVCVLCINYYALGKPMPFPALITWHPHSLMSMITTKSLRQTMILYYAADVRSRGKKTLLYVTVQSVRKLSVLMMNRWVEVVFCIALFGIMYIHVFSVWCRASGVHLMYPCSTSSVPLLFLSYAPVLPL